ncbi:hypothetical protein BGX26_000542 [Mortierella sp. AD094]|nr:hypothetical protein BGX26_000542 [Mortierella sp. AD094]
MSLSTIQASMAHQMADGLRYHFQRLPSVVVRKMRACNLPEAEIPKLEGENESPEEEDDPYSIISEDVDDGDEADEDSEGDGSSAFCAGHIRRWWSECAKLSKINRPVFCPSAGFSDVFIDFSERAILELL